MKKLLTLTLAAALALSLAACGGENSNSESSDNSQNIPPVVSDMSSNDFDTSETPIIEENMDDFVPSGGPKLSEETIPEMTGEELETALMEQPMYVESTKYVIQDEQYKALYPDLLQAVIKNNSGTDVKNATVMFAAWDENGFPVKIVPYYEYNGGSYVVGCVFEDVNMIDGATYGQNAGLELNSDPNNIAILKAMVFSFDDFDGNTWYNPYYDTWIKMYEDQKLN